MTNLFKLYTFVLCFLLLSCSSNRVKNDPKTTNIVDYSKDVVTELSGGLDKWISHKNNKLQTFDDYELFTTSFFPRKGIYAVIESYEKYCTTNGNLWSVFHPRGTKQFGGCYSSEPRTGSSLVWLITADAGHQVTGTHKIYLNVYASKINNGATIYKIAKDEGFLLPVDAELLAFKNRLQAQAKLEKEQERNQRLMKQLGTQICFTKGSGLSPLTGYIEQITSDKIQIRVSKTEVISYVDQGFFTREELTIKSKKQHLIWDNPENWTVCE